MRKFLATAIFVLFTAGSAWAVPIDFTVGEFVGISGDASYYSAYFGLTITPINGLIYQDSPDGLGVIGDYEYDEIEGNELLNLHFDEVQIINSMLITDLFIEQENDSTAWYNEIGFYLLGDLSYSLGDWTPMTAIQSTGTNGELTVALDPTPVTDIWFWAPGYVNDVVNDIRFVDGRSQDHEFSVAMIDAQPVPEPSSLMLLGVGIVGLCVYRKRKENK